MAGVLTTSSQTLTDLQRISSQMAILLDESRVQRLGAALDTVAKTASPLAESVVIAHAMAQDLDAFRRGMSGSASTLLQAGKHSAALLDGLQQLVARLVRIDELTIRRFIQEEGIRVKLGTSRDVKDRIEELREQ